MGVTTTGNYTFTSWLITARGNIVPLDTPKPQTSTGPGTVTWSLVSQDIGAFQFHFTSFKYYNVTDGKTLKPAQAFDNLTIDRSII